MVGSTHKPGAAALHGERISFTGRLASMAQKRAVELVRAAGGQPVQTVSRRTTLLVVGMYGWPLLPDGQVSSKLRFAEELIRQGVPLRTISERVFLEMLGLANQQPAVDKSFTAEKICELLKLQPETLRRWEQLSLVQSCDGHYDFQDVVSLQTVADLVRRGVRPEALNRSLRGLSNVVPGTERPLAQLKIVLANRSELLAELEDALVDERGQMLMKFEHDGVEKPEQAVVTVDPTDHSAQHWFEYGQSCEEAEEYSEAARAYGRAISMQTRFPEAHFNLGNVVRATGSLDTALDLYRTAAEQDAELACAWYNIADILYEKDRHDEAIVNLHNALEACADYPDAHFNLAMCYERVGARKAACRHWQAYLALDRTSEWADLARSHLALPE
jgi:tetratricopeptide (TPR) repeat protein